MLTTAGMLGILGAVPLVPLSPRSWQRALLFVGGATHLFEPTSAAAASARAHPLLLAALLNVAAPVLRYFAASQRSYAWVLISNVLQGCAFGIIGAWPPMLASLQWPERRRTVSARFIASPQHAARKRPGTETAVGSEQMRLGAKFVLSRTLPSSHNACSS